MFALRDPIQPSSFFLSPGRASGRARCAAYTTKHLPAKIYCSASGWLSAQNFDSPESSGGTAFKPKLYEDMHKMLFNGAFAETENRGNVGIGLALSDPEQDLSFA